MPSGHYSSELSDRWSDIYHASLRSCLEFARQPSHGLFRKLILSNTFRCAAIQAQKQVGYTAVEVPLKVNQRGPLITVPGFETHNPSIKREVVAMVGSKERIYWDVAE